MKEQNIILWDLMRTLISPNPTKRAVKPDIIPVLKRLSDQGFSHHVTSLSNKNVIEMYLEGTGLSDFFQRFWGKENLGRFSSQDKSYDFVLSELGMTEEDARKRILVIGDSEGDYPGSDILFIKNKDGHRSSARAEEEIINKLLQIDPSDIGRAYSTLYDSIISAEGKKKLNIAGYTFDLKRSRFGMTTGKNTYYRPQIEVVNNSY